MTIQFNVEELRQIFQEEFRNGGFNADECEKAGRIIIDYFTLLERINSKENIIQID